VPDLKETQIGDDAASSIKVFNTIAPEDIFTSFTSKLSQDYRMVGGTLEEFSAYRTTLRFDPGDSQSDRKVEVKISATYATAIEVESATYEVDEIRSVTLSPNSLNVLMITSEADGLDTPDLKFRTSQMAPNEQMVIFPNKEAHQQIAGLEDGALWNATDAKGQLIVDRDAHSKAEVASVQNTIKRMMATVQMLEAFENAISAGLTLSEGVFDSIQALIANPREPEAALIIIIEALRDAVMQSLEAVENMALGLLDIVSLAIDLFKDLLNKEIRIPFISDLLDLIGVGKLTVLNLATIVLAIPVTVTAKLVTGKHLFTRNTPLPFDLPNPADKPDSIRDLRKDVAFTTIVTVADTTNY